MKIKNFLLCVVLIFSCFASVSCRGRGTEVINPQDTPPFAIPAGAPDDQTAEGRYTNRNYAFSLEFPNDWSYTEFDGANPPSVDLYRDPLGEAQAVVLFEDADNLQALLILADYLSSGEELSSYVSARIGDGDIASSESEDGAEVIFVYPETGDDAERIERFAYKALKQVVNYAEKYLVLSFRYEMPNVDSNTSPDGGAPDFASSGVSFEAIVGSAESVE